MQVASRVILVWAIVDQFPAATSKSLAYSTMLLAWSATEVVRYSYFVFNLNGSVPGILQWLRYNGFFVLYPLGISSEMFLVYLSIVPASKRDVRLGYGLYAILGLYIPGESSRLIALPVSAHAYPTLGAYILYTHMMTQRRRVMRGKAKAK
jgi:very-long-chain (3R)-3-hydroxyacyl-CoA dehydratase